MKPGDPPQADPVQLDSRKLAPGDSWTWTCRWCPIVTQGGRGGYDAHVATVHPEHWKER